MTEFRVRQLTWYNLSPSTSLLNFSKIPQLKLSVGCHNFLPLCDECLLKERYFDVKCASLTRRSHLIKVCGIYFDASHFRNSFLLSQIHPALERWNWEFLRAYRTCKSDYLPCTGRKKNDRGHFNKAYILPSGYSAAILYAYINFLNQFINQFQ